MASEVEETLKRLVGHKVSLSVFGIFLENDFWTPPRAPPPPINFVHGSDRKLVS